MKLHPIRARILCGATVIASLAFTSSASAAILSLDPPTQFTSIFSTPVDLTAEGTLDWAYWEYTGSGLASPLAPTNKKLGASLISGASAVNDGEGANGALRGSTSAKTVGRYSFSDGTTLLSDTNREMAGLLFNSKIGSGAVGDGISLQITGNPEEEQIVRLYLGGFAATAELKLTLAGATTVVDTSQTFGVGDKWISVYTVHFRPDSITDLLTVTYTASSTTVGNVNSHVGLEAVTVAVPEPGSAVLLGIGGLALASRRRRRA